MNNRLRHIAYAWIVLICFAVGQIAAFTHQHPVVKISLSKNTSSGQTLKEKCYVCDAMHHTYMAVFAQATPSVFSTVIHTPYDRQHDYVGIALILSAGRSPPQA
jgi:hypothetical protein